MDAAFVEGQVVEHATHQEALAWAMGRAGPGAVLEIGTGWGSTPLLHGWAEAQGRWLCSIETEDGWAERMASLYGEGNHVVRWLPRGVVQLPVEQFALAFVDGINEDRAAWLRELRHERALVVVHDTERTRDAEFPGMAAALEDWPNRRDFTHIYPWTSVLW